MEEMICPPFLLRKEGNEIVLLHNTTEKCIARFQSVVMERVWNCLQQPDVLKERRVNCHGFVDHVIHGGDPRKILQWDLVPGHPMDMHDAREKFGLPHGIQFWKKYSYEHDVRGGIDHSALVLAWDQEEPIVADKWGYWPPGLRYMKESRLHYPHEKVLCYPATCDVL